MNNKFIIYALLVLCSTNAHAQTQTPEELDPIIITTATRMAQHGYKIAGNVTVITKEQIKASNAQNIPDVLRQSLGTFVYDLNTVKTSTVDIRGFGDTASRNVLVLVNERKINTVDMSGPDLLQIPVEAVERIEVIRGAGSVLYGDNAVGGVINIITKQGKGDLSGRVGGFYGSYDRQGTDTEISGEWKNISYFLYSKYADERGYRQNSDVLTKDFNGRLGYKFSEKISTSLDFGWHEDSYDLPGGLTAAQIAATSRRATFTPNDVADTEDQFMKWSFDVKPWPEDIDLGKLVVDLHARKRDVFDSFSGFDTNRNIHTLGVTPKYIFDHPVFNHEVNFVTGIDYYDTENDIIGSGSNTDNLTISKEEFGVYGFAEVELLPDVFANGGTRFHEANYTFSQLGVADEQKRNPDEWVSMGGVKYEYDRGSTVHANVQQTFRFLATDEWYTSFDGDGDGNVDGVNTSLEHQTGIQYEAGIKHNLNDIVLLSATPYWIINNNEIFFDPSNGFFGANSNYDKTHRVGVEIGSKLDVNHFLEWNFLDKIELATNYTYQNARFGEGANDGKYIPMVPQHQVTNSLTTQFLKYYNLGLSGRYIGSRYAINDTLNQTSPIKPYCVLDLHLAYERDLVEVYFNVNNIMNEQYSPYIVKSTTSTTKREYPAPETNFTAGVNLKF